MATTVRPRLNSPGKDAVYAVLKIERLHPKETVPVAVLLIDRSGDRIFLRFREDLASVVDPTEQDILCEMPAAIARFAREEGASRLLDYFLDTSSGNVRMDKPEVIPTPLNWKQATDQLFNEKVKPHIGLTPSSELSSVLT